MRVAGKSEEYKVKISGGAIDEVDAMKNYSMV